MGMARSRLRLPFGVGVAMCSESAKEFDQGFRDEFIDLLKWRRHVRSFKAEALTTGTIERMIGVGGLAPSVGLSQPWWHVDAAGW